MQETITHCLGTIQLDSNSLSKLNTMKKYKYIITSLLVAFCSCSYLNVSDQLSGGLTNTDEIFENVDYTRRWYATTFNNIPDYSGMCHVGVNGFQNPWAAMCDELVVGYGTAAMFNNSDKNESSYTSFNRWGDCFKQIRQANVFLAKAHPILTSGTQANELTENELTEMKANIRFIRAFYNYFLFEAYGPYPLVYDKIFETAESQDIPRNSIDEILEYIDSELLAVSKELPQEPIEDNNYLGWPTKGVALAVRAKLWLYAASPLYNGGYKEAMMLTNNDGKKLFPAADASKWGKAVSALKDFMDYADAGRYELYSTGNPAADVYDVFQKNSKEIIWSTSRNSWGGLDGDTFDRRSTPRVEQNGLGSTAVTQGLVDAFYDSEGYPITDTKFAPASPTYTEEGFSDYNGEQVYNMYINREPRFYNTVFFQNRKWHMTNTVIKFYNGSSNDISGQHTKTGYMLYKRMNRKITKKNMQGAVVSQFRPSIIFRLADFYLMYAEAVNEVNPADVRVLTYLNKVRERAGIKPLEDINPNIRGNQEAQRLAIQRERRIELATEGQRYFDVRRWMIADVEGEGNQHGWAYGMNMNGTSGVENEFYKRVEASRIVFRKKMYLMPIPHFEMSKTYNIVQNPGW